MAARSESRHGMWSSRWLFILAAAGSAVGLGNIWKFPYLVGANGGAAFVLIYLLCIGLVGVPIMMAEVMLGREGRQSPINTMRALVQQHHRHPAWVLIGWLGVIAGFLILSYYVVIAGWALHYIVEMARGALAGATAAEATGRFESFLQSPWQVVLWQTVFMAWTVYIIGRGVVKGLEAAIRWFMPLLLLIMVVLLGYSLTTEGFRQGFEFMFAFDWAEVSGETVLAAMGQAFFTLSLGMGAMMAYGAYLPSNVSIGRTVATVALLDTLVALSAGLVIFPIVFTNGLQPDQGPGLMFVTLPLAFGNLPLGSLFGTLFFLLVSFAAITSAISIAEPTLAYLVETYNAKRKRVSISIGVIGWIIGLGTAFSFNLWSDVHFGGERTFFELVDHVSQNIMLPVGGMLIALFAAWALPKTVVGAQLGFDAGWANVLWKIVAGVVAPLGVLAVFLAQSGLIRGLFAS